MNDEKLRQARTNLYLRMAQRLIKAVAPFLGTRADPKELANRTRPYVQAARSQAQTLAYRDYVLFVDKQDPIPKMEQNRFTDELWQGSVDKVLADVDVFGSDEAEQLALSGDYWARDAEWGQRVDVAKNDPRIGKIARVDFKPPTCPFCTMLNSRGPVYLSQESAMRTLHTGDTCMCIFVGKNETDYPGIESTKIAKDRYDKAVKDLGTAANTTTILKALDRQDPDRAEGSVKANARNAVQAQTKSKIDQAKARISMLERINPKSDSAIKYRDQELARNREILKALEGTPAP